MAEEKSAPKKEKAPKAPKAAKPTDAPEGAVPAAAPAAAAPAAPAADAKPTEMVGGVAKQPTAEDLLKEELGAIKVRKAKGSKNVTSGFANVLASFNNTIVSITDPKGQVIAWSSAGKCNFRGSQRHVPRPEGRRDPRLRSRPRPRQRHPRAAGDRPRDHVHRRCDAHPTQ